MRRVDLRELVDNHHVAQDVETGPAQLLRPGHAKKAELTHALDGWPRELSRRVIVSSNRRYLIARKSPDGFAYGEVLFCEVQVVVH